MTRPTFKAVLDRPCRSFYDELVFFNDWTKRYLWADGFTLFDLDSFRFVPAIGRCVWVNWGAADLEGYTDGVELPDYIERWLAGNLEGYAHGVAPARGGKIEPPHDIQYAALTVHAVTRQLLERNDDLALSMFFEAKSVIEGHAKRQHVESVKFGSMGHWKYGEEEDKLECQQIAQSLFRKNPRKHGTVSSLAGKKYNHVDPAPELWEFVVRYGEKKVRSWISEIHPNAGRRGRPSK